MKRAQWATLLQRAPAGLTLKKLAKVIGQNYRPTAMWARRLEYPAANGHLLLWSAQRRREFSRVPWWLVPWRLSNSDIARKYGVSRCIVIRRRKEYDNHRPRSA